MSAAALRRVEKAGITGPHATIADAVAASIAGQRAAGLALDAIARGTSHPDQLHVVMIDVRRRFGEAGLVGAHRRLQKALERG